MFKPFTNRYLEGCGAALLFDVDGLERMRHALFVLVIERLERHEGPEGPDKLSLGRRLGRDNRIRYKLVRSGHFVYDFVIIFVIHVSDYKGTIFFSLFIYRISFKFDIYFFKLKTNPSIWLRLTKRKK